MSLRSPPYEWADQAALAIGERLVSDAMVDGDMATWLVPKPVRGARPRRTELNPADGSLYAGTAGIALALSELGRVTGRTDFTALARQALEHALREGPGGDAEDPHPSLHAGSVGSLFAAASLFRHTEDPPLRRRTEALLERLEDLPEDRRTGDVIGGAAGAIPALLAIDDVFPTDRIERVCVQLGEGLVASARVEAEGLSWPSGAVRRANLCGLAHGAAGPGRALLELFARTGRRVFRLAAEEAFAYEKLWYDPERGNWRDLRNGPLHEYKVDGRLHELQGLLDRGEPLPLYEEHYMAAWCHGAPGIAMTRARAYQVLGASHLRDEAMAGLRTTEASLDAPGFGHSLCHGFMGNAEALLVSARMLGLEERAAAAMDRIEAVTRSVLDSNVRWVGGRHTPDPDPCLMTGEAGIALFLLGLSRPVPSATFPRVEHPDDPTEVHDEAPLRARIVRTCFRQACEHDERTAVALEASAAQKPAVRGHVPVAWRARNASLAMLPTADGVRPMLEADLRTLERQRSRPFDYGLATIASAVVIRDSEREALAPAPWAKLEGHGGRPWLMHPDTSGRWTFRPVAEEVALLLRSLDPPVSGEELVARVGRATDLSPEELRPWVRAQLEELIRAGIVIGKDLDRALAAEQG